MGQKVHPIGFRLGVYRDWDARWFARDSYGKQLMEDLAIRKLLSSSLDRAEVARVEIEKAGDNVRIIIHSARPGVVIGKKGQEIEVWLDGRLQFNMECEVYREMDIKIIIKPKKTKK